MFGMVILLGKPAVKLPVTGASWCLASTPERTREA